MLAWALAADTPTIIARALNPPSKVCFITLPPFGQENATLFIGSITGNKIKEASARRKRISGHLGGKIRINAGVPAGVSLPAGSACIETRGPPFNGPRAQARTPDRPAVQYVLLVAEGAGRGCKRPSVLDPPSPAARLPCQRGFGLQKPRLPAIPSCTHISKVGRVQFSCMTPPPISVSAHQGLS